MNLTTTMMKRSLLMSVLNLWILMKLLKRTRLMNHKTIAEIIFMRVKRGQEKDETPTSLTNT